MKQRAPHLRARSLAAAAALIFCLVVGGALPTAVLPTAVLSVAARPPEKESPDRGLQAVLAAALSESAAVIELSGRQVSPAALTAAYVAVLQDDPSLFHVAPRLSYATAAGASSAGAAVTAVYPVYTLAGEALAAARRFYADTVSALTAEVRGMSPPLTEAEVALRLHDLLAERYEYDTRGGSDDSPNADAYTFFRDGRGVCQAYALAYIALCRAAGLAAHFVASAEMDHAWVHVRVSGVWYHVDVTRDDPIPAPGGAGVVDHTRFLRSDGALAAMGYTGYTCAAGCRCQADGYAPLAVLSGALIPILTGNGRRWVGMKAEEPAAAAVDGCGATVYAPGDIDGDGELTPADLLVLYDPAVPEEIRARLRTQLVAA